MSKFMNKLSDKFGDLSTKAERFKETVAYAVNPDHRHDEEHEKAEDEARMQLRREHRFESFAPVRDGNLAKWYINGHSYFWALSEIIENAKETIFIADWWLTPELFLRRPPEAHPEFRLDRLLLRKAEQGVDIYVMVYKEVVQSMSMSSAHTKHHLEDLHERIRCVRHPDHLGGEVTLFYSHHEKIVVVDNLVACIGGLDICFGRWDTGAFPLADLHPTDMSRTIFPGQDLNNARIQDFVEVDKWAANNPQRTEAARMPWHDVHSMLVGPAVLDISQHFVERWNFICGLKYRHKSRYPLLAFPHIDGLNDGISRHPHFERLKEEGRHYFCHHKEPGEEGAHSPPVGGTGLKGSARVQVLRSASDWSHGIHPTEASIQAAYCQMIAESKSFVLLSNQFFITSASSDPKSPVKNLIGQALVQRVLSAHKRGEKFKVVIIIPAIPGFAGDLYGNSGTLAILGAQYFSLSRGGNSIFELLEREGVNASDYIEVYNLRSFDRLNYDPERIKRMEEASGVTLFQAQAALARVYLGQDALASELEKNKTVKFTIPQEGGEVQMLDGKDNKGKAAKPNPVVQVPLPASYDEAWATIRRFEGADSIRDSIADSISHLSQAGTGSVVDEPWSGDEASERRAFVTEELYIHSKLLIVDDQRCLIGSANINERSMLGDRDSEIAVVIEDFDDLIPSRLDGKPVMVSRFAATLRRQLYKDHLGLSAPEMCPPVGDEPVTASMRPVGTLHDDATGSQEDELVMDPLDPRTEALLRDTAARNAEIFDDLFHCVPSKNVETWAQYKAFVPQAPIKPGHIASLDMPVSHIKEQLSQIKGHIVTCPLNFLKGERLYELSAEVNKATLPIYL
ncbi:hypothetical protein JCM3775_007130 [Rhodotorula graminis]